jgi:hypothetical protein
VFAQELKIFKFGWILLAQGTKTFIILDEQCATVTRVLEARDLFLVER